MRSALLILLACTSLAAPITQGAITVTAALPAGTGEDDVEVSIVLDGATMVICTLPANTSSSSRTFKCKVDLGNHTALVQVRARGFKTYLVNFASLEVKPDWPVALQLGEIQLTPLIEPTIENIVRSESKDRSLRYQITVQNPFKKKLLVTGLTIIGSCTCGGSLLLRSAAGVSRNGRQIADYTCDTWHSRGKRWRCGPRRSSGVRY